MRPASSLSIPLLLLLLTQQGLQLPLSSRASSMASLSNRTLNCSAVIGEVLAKLAKIPDDLSIDAQIKLMNQTLWRENLCAFLEAPASLKFQHMEMIRSNLETLALCLPEESTPTLHKPLQGDGVVIINVDDFRKYLKFYLIQLDAYLVPRLINVSSDTEKMKC